MTDRDQTEQPEWEYAGHQSCRAEIERLTALLAEIDEIGTLEHARRHITCGQIIVSKDAEIERLQRLVEKRVTKAEEIQRRHDAVTALADEIGRLRAALREVVAQGHLDACKISVGRCNCAYSDAVEALAAPTRPEHQPVKENQ